MRGVRRWGLCLWLAAGGCDQLRGSDDEPAPPAEPAPAPEPSPEPTPTPAPALPAVGIELVDAGKEPRIPIGVQPTPGTARQIVLALRVTRLGRHKAPLFPYVRASFDATLDAVDEGSKQRKFTLRSVRLPEFDPEDPAESTRLVGRHQTFLAGVTATQADRFDAIAIPAPAEPDMRAVMSTTGLALSHLTLPLPAEPIGEGATWTVRRDLVLFGVPVRQTLECEAKRREGSQFELAANVSYALAPNPGTVEAAPFDLATVESVTGEGRLTAMLDLASATPVELRLRGKVSLQGKNAQGESRAHRLGLDLRVDENFLSQKDDRVKLAGDFTQGGLVVGTVAPGAKVWFQKKRIKVSSEGDFLIGFGHNAPGRAVLSFQLPDGPIERHVLSVADRTFEPETIDGLPEEMVKLDNETKRALAKSRKMVDRVRRRASDFTYFKAGWQWPTKGKITSTYGRKRILNGVEKGYHWGVDLAAPVGREVFAPAPGKVVLAEQDVPLSGMLLILDHGHGLTSSFLHLSKFDVSKGDMVEAGQRIGAVGNTGRSTGPHLDWRMNLFDTRIDPQLLLDDPS